MLADLDKDAIPDKRSPQKAAYQWMDTILELRFTLLGCLPLVQHRMFSQDLQLFLSSVN